MTTIREEIAKNLLYYRKKAGLTQKQLADKLGVKNTAVSNWESGNNSVDIESLFLASEIFGVTLNDMYGRYSKDTVSHALKEDEAQLLEDYRSLNLQGQAAALAAVHGLTDNPIFKKGNSSASGAMDA